MSTVASLHALLTARDVAERLNCSDATVRRLHRSGQLPAVRLSAKGHLRFDALQVERFVLERTHREGEHHE